jgi:hypothetical protein
MFKQDFFESNLSVEEAADSSTVGGVAVLGKLKGQFFVPNGTSRNNRFYAKSLWEKQLSKPELKKRLRERRMFGTISHDQALDDKALLDGKISHIVTELYIDPQTGKGMGEAIILNTAAGQILNTVLRAGGKLFVSSRATGKFEGEHKGIPKVDEDTYALTTFDVVMDPGFLEANPSIAESLVKIFDETTQNQEMHGEIDMLQEKLIRENQDLTSTVASLSEAKKSAEGRAEKAEASVASLSEKVAKLEADVASLAKYKEFGTLEEIEKALELSKTKTESVERENTRLTGVVSAFADLGTVEEVAKVIEVAEAQKAELDEYKALGSIDQLNKVLDFAESIMDERDNAAKTAEVDALAKELGVAKEVIEKVYGKMPVAEIKEFVGGIKKVAEWKPTGDEGGSNKPSEEAPKGGYQPDGGKPRATNIMEGLVKIIPKDKRTTNA